MAKLKIATILDDKPVKLTIELPAGVYRDLHIYARLVSGTSDASMAVEPTKLIVPMLQKFMASDREFSKARRSSSLEEH